MAWDEGGGEGSRGHHWRALWWKDFKNREKLLSNALNKATMLRWLLSIISMSMLHIYVHAACPGSCCMPVSMLHAHVHATCMCQWCMPMSMLHIHDHAACPCPYCMFMSMLLVHAHVVCLCSCCMPVLMLYAHAVCPCCLSTDCMSFCTAKYAAFCGGMLTEPPTMLSPLWCTDKNEKEEFFSEEFFTINKEMFPYCQGIIFLPYSWRIIYWRNVFSIIEEIFPWFESNW